jgi:hypothetical protein
VFVVPGFAPPAAPVVPGFAPPAVVPPGCAAVLVAPGCAPAAGAPGFAPPAGAAGFAAGAFGAAAGAFGALGALFFCAIATPGSAISASNTKIRCTIAMFFLGFISLPPDLPRGSRGCCFVAPEIVGTTPTRIA